jgi:hypothetical protein
MYYDTIASMNRTQQLLCYAFIEKSEPKGGRKVINLLCSNANKVFKAIKDLELSYADLHPEDGKKPLTKPEKQQIQNKILEGIVDHNGIIEYHSTKRTSRIFTSDTTLLGLCREVRNAACTGLYDMDLKSSQFIIISNHLGAKQAMQFIKDNKHIWTEMNYIVTGKYEKPERWYKEVFKAFLYSLCFGMGPYGLECTLDNIPNGSKILEWTMIEELLQLRQEWLDRITREEHIEDVWGNLHYIREAELDEDKGVDAKSLAARRITSIELELMAGVYNYLLENEGDIDPYFQLHDGCTVRIIRKHKLHIAGLQQAIKQQSKIVSDMVGFDLSDMTLEVNKL